MIDEELRSKVKEWYNIQLQMQENKNLPAFEALKEEQVETLTNMAGFQFWVLEERRKIVMKELEEVSKKVMDLFSHSIKKK